MIRNITSILIAIVYLNLSIGISLNAHICQQEIQSIGILSDSDNCCDHSESDVCHTETQACTHNNHDIPEHDNCCSDEEIEIKLDIEQFNSAKKLKIKTPEIAVLYNLKSLFENEIIENNIFSHYSSPHFKENIPDIPFRISNNQFTFYG